MAPRRKKPATPQAMPDAPQPAARQQVQQALTASAEAGSLSKGRRVAINYIYQSPSVLFTQQEGIVLCSAYNRSLEDAKGSLGEVMRQMKEAGVDLRPRLQQVVKDHPPMTNSDGNSSSTHQIIQLWQRDAAIPAGIKCDVILLAVLPQAWSTPDNRECPLEEVEAALQDLQDLYADIRAALAEHVPKTTSGCVNMVSVGVTGMYPREAVVQEVAALAAYCDDLIPKARSITICTFNRETLDMYKDTFNKDGWRDRMSWTELDRLSGVLQRQLSRIKRSMPDLVSRKVHDILAATASLSVQCMIPKAASLSISTNANSSNSGPADRTPYLLVFLCCAQSRLAVEACLQHIVSLDAAICDKVWQQQKPSPGARMMVGNILSVLAAVKKVKPSSKIAALYSEEVKLWFDTVKNTGNKAMHCTAKGDVTIVDANTALWALSQVLEALLSKA